MIIEYVVHLRDNVKLQRKSIIVHVSAIRYLFYSIRDDEFPITLKRAYDELPPQKYTHRDRGYSVEEIQKMLEVGCQGRVRERVAILLLTSAGGMRIGGLHILKKGDLKEMHTTPGEKVYGIRIYSDSSQDYFTPCSPECTVAIDRYLEERASAGEMLKYDSPVIRNLYDSLSVKAVKPLSYQGIKNLVRTVVKLSGIRNGFEFAGQVKESRGFRKFYKGEADLSGMVPGIVELTQGHNIGMATHYLTPKESDILKEYEKVLDRITIDEKHRLKKRNEELEKGYLAELGELRQEFNELKELLGYVGSGEPELVKKELQRRMMQRARDMIGYDLSGATSFEAQDKAELLDRLTKQREE